MRRMQQSEEKYNITNYQGKATSVTYVQKFYVCEKSVKIKFCSVTIYFLYVRVSGGCE